MKILSLTPVRLLQFTALLLLCTTFAIPHAYAQSAIKMLPPTNCPNVPVGQPNVWGVLGWDSKSPLSCIPNFSFGDNSYVGIGLATSQPLALLDLYGSATYSYPTPGTGTVGTKLGNIHLQPVDNINDNSSAITFGGNMFSSPSNNLYDGVAEAGIYVQYGGYGTKMYFGTTNTWTVGSQIHMMIDAIGNVGVGTISPQTTLDVNGPINLGRVTTTGGATAIQVGQLCTPEGAFGYDSTSATHQPVYCNSSLQWATIGASGGGTAWHNCEVSTYCSANNQPVGARTLGTVYKNLNSYPIEVAVNLENNNGNFIQTGGSLTVNGVGVDMFFYDNTAGVTQYGHVYGTVAPQATYSVSPFSGSVIASWSEFY
jgi:hypothetical protein